MKLYAMSLKFFSTLHRYVLRGKGEGKKSSPFPSTRIPQQYRNMFRLGTHNQLTSFRNLGFSFLLKADTKIQKSPKRVRIQTSI